MPARLARRERVAQWKRFCLRLIERKPVKTDRERKQTKGLGVEGQGAYLNINVCSTRVEVAGGRLREG